MMLNPLAQIFSPKARPRPIRSADLQQIQTRNLCHPYQLLPALPEPLLPLLALPT